VSESVYNAIRQAVESTGVFVSEYLDDMIDSLAEAVEEALAQQDEDEEAGL
jgi:hypothetical protein